MTEYRIAKATAEDVLAVASTLRPQDVFEISASSDKDPASVVVASYKGSRDAWVGLADGVPICLFGVYSPALIAPYAHPWFYGTRFLKQHRKEFLRQGRGVAAGIAAIYGDLRNWVDVRNTPAIQWLKWLGFEVSDEIVRFPRVPGKFHPYRYGRKP